MEEAREAVGIGKCEACGSVFSLSTQSGKVKCPYCGHTQAASMAAALMGSDAVEAVSPRVSSERPEGEPFVTFDKESVWTAIKNDLRMKFGFLISIGLVCLGALVVLGIPVMFILRFLR